MTEINKKLRSSLLSAPMIIKNYVAGDENCNYEKYLLEMEVGEDDGNGVEPMGVCRCIRELEDTERYEQ